MRLENPTGSKWFQLPNYEYQFHDFSAVVFFGPGQDLPLIPARFATEKKCHSFSWKMWFAKKIWGSDFQGLIDAESSDLPSFHHAFDDDLTNKTPVSSCFVQPKCCWVDTLSKMETKKKTSLRKPAWEKTDSSNPTPFFFLLFIFASWIFSCHPFGKSHALLNTASIANVQNGILWPLVSKKSLAKWLPSFPYTSWPGRNFRHIPRTWFSRTPGEFEVMKLCVFKTESTPRIWRNCQCGWVKLQILEIGKGDESCCFSKMLSYYSLDMFEHPCKKTFLVGGFNPSEKY